MTDKIIGHIGTTEVHEGILDHQVHDCPTCKSELQTAYGLAGGGLGTYGYCEVCGVIVWKCLTED